MDPEQARRWREADRLFSVWLDLSEAQRPAWLATQALPPPLRDSLQQLIAEHLKGDPELPALASIAQTATQTRTPRNQLAGRRIGSWELIEEIGRGGMSVVYRARRLDVDFEQIAAVKLLGMAALGSEGSARFEQERRMLARLRHPHIAALIDGGFAEDGTPFLAMALVEGQTLAKYCDGRELDWGARVHLLMQICDAVSHAHRNLMVHRDLKPSNIMVTPEGVPMLLDFGIAKLLDDEHDETRTGMRALTPGYAAPEQVAGGTITTATDVYALGVILRELCAPCRVLPQDLKNIIAMAMRDDPARRYPDARALGEDLQRLLEQRAVHATPDSAGYRFRALLRRRRGFVLSTVSAALALIVGLGLALWQAERAARQAEEARRQATRAEAARDFLFSMISAGDREETERVDLPISSVIERGVAKLQEAPPDDPQLHAEMAMLLGHLDTSNGQYARAASLLDTALTSAERVDDANLWVGVRVRQGVLANARGDPAGALAHFDAALARIDAVSPSRRAALLISTYGGWAYAMNNVGRGAEARARLQRELAIEPDPWTPAQRIDLILPQVTLTVEPEQQLELLAQVQAAFAHTPPSPADRLVLEAQLGTAYGRLRRFAESLAHTREAAALADQVHPGATSRRARMYNNLGNVLNDAGLPGEADAAYAVAEQIYRQLGDDDSPAFAALLHNRGTLLRDLGAAELAVPLIEAAYLAAQRQFGAQDRRSAIALRNLAFARAEAGSDPDAAEREWRQAWALAPVAMPPRDRIDLLLIGAHIGALAGDAATATERLGAAEALADGDAGAVELTPVQRIRRETLLGASLSLGPRASEADAHFQRALTLAAETDAGTWSARWRCHLAYAVHLRRHGRQDEARGQEALVLQVLESSGAAVESALLGQLRASAGQPEVRR